MYNIGKVKERFALLLLSIFLVSFTACGGARNEEQPTTTGGSSAATAESNPPSTLTVEVWERGIQGAPAADKTNPANYIRENFKKETNIDITFITVPRSEEVTKLTMMLAGNEAPDVCLLYDKNIMYNFVSNGGVAELGPTLDQYGSTVKEYLGEEVLSYGVFDGKQYAVPGKRPLRAMDVGYIRKDWLDKVGMSAPTNLNELYDVLRAFKEKDPGGNGKQNVPYGLAVSTTIYGAMMPISDFLVNASTEMSLEEYFVTGHGFGSYIARPGAKEGLRYLNKLYNEGLISPDWAIMTAQEFDNSLTAGQVGAWYGNIGAPLNAPNGAFYNLKKIKPEAELMPMNAFENYEGKHYHQLYAPIGMFVFVPQSSTKVVEAVKYLNWLSKPETVTYLTYGIEGVNFDMVDGLPVSRPIDSIDEKDKLWNSGDFCVMGSDLGSQEKNIENVARNIVSTTNMKEFGDLYKELYKVATSDPAQDINFYIANEAATKRMNDIGQKQSDVVVKSITCKPGDFDKTFDDGLKDFLNSGGQAVIDENKKLFPQYEQTLK